MGEESPSDKVWIPDREKVWTIAEVIGFDEKTKKLEIAMAVNGRYETRTIDKEAALSWDKDHDENFPNAFKMSDLNEAALLGLLEKRSKEEQIYTFTGDILLSVNPYTEIKGLYEPMPSVEALKDYDPHLYVLAAKAYEDLFNTGLNGTSQAILINGESGAGKTEAAKRIMAFLMELSKRKRDAQKKKKKKGRGGYGGARMPKRGKPMQPTVNANKMRGSIRRLKVGVQDTFHRMRGSTKRPNNDIIPVDRNQSAIEKIILRTNPLLEAFGNARTIRNDNSSRFGKFVQMEYDKEEIIKGAQTKHFLLEKSRVTNHGRGERNYHIFYQMCAAYEGNPNNPSFSELSMLKSFDHYKYLTPTAAVATEVSAAKRPSMMTKKPKANSRDGVGKMAQRAVEYLENHKAEVTHKDREVFEFETSVALEQMNLEIDEQKNIWKVLAAILHLGNLEIITVQKADTRGQMVEVVTVANDEVDVNGEKKSTLELCAKLLGVQAHLLVNALTMKTMTAGNKRSVTTVPLSLEDAIKSKDGLAKAIYEALFEWMLQRINIATGSAMEKVVAAAAGSAPFAMNQKKKAKPQKVSNPVFIGILDIFGFEMLEDNSFEQLCINYANEALQGMFDNHVFELEKEAYEEENIDVAQLNLEFRDNVPLLELLNKRGTGIFQLMDEQGAIKSGSDKGLYRAIEKMHSPKPGQKKKKVGEVKRFAGAIEGANGRFYFRINHFAGIVQYTVDGMVEKNSDHLQADLADLIAVGGMPVEEAELTPEEEKQQEMDQRMNKRKPQKATSKPGSKISNANSQNQGQNSNSFSFLQMILKLRSDKAKGPVEEDPAQDAEDKKPKKARRGRRDRQKKMAALQSLSSRFRKEMTSLQKLLDTTEQHFVRCIKPNDLKVPPTEKWDHHMVNAQLRMLGALEMVRVRRMGFPIRTLFEEFLPKFPELCTKHKITFEKGIEDRKACVAFMHQIDDTGKNKRWHLGDTKLFLQESTFKQLNDEERTIRDAKVEKEEKLRRLQEQQARMEKEHNASIVVQKMMRMYYFRNRFLKGKKGIIKLQAIARGLKHKRGFAKTVKMVILIQKIARGFIIRKRYGKLSKVALLLNPVAKGFLVRKKTNRIMELKNRYKKCLQPGECVVLESLCQADQGKRLDATLTKSYSLLLTTGPFPRILYANNLTGALHTELSWDDRVLCGLMANEHKLVLYSKPVFKHNSTSRQHDDSDQKLYKFQFTQPVTAIWLLALKEVFSIHDVLNMKTPDFDKLEAENPGCSKKMIEEHGNLQPLNLKTNKTFLFGGDSVFGGNKPVLREDPGKLTQSREWRNRYFVLKECTLFWFRTDDDPGQSWFPVGGLNLSASTTVEMASTDKKFFNKVVKQKATLQIESRLLRQSLKLNFSSGKTRQGWVTKIRNTIKSRTKGNESKKLSISKGILDTKGFSKISAQELASSSAYEEGLKVVPEDLRLGDEEGLEDIEQDEVQEIL